MTIKQSHIYILSLTTFISFSTIMPSAEAFTGALRSGVTSVRSGIDTNKAKSALLFAILSGLAINFSSKAHHKGKYIKEKQAELSHPSSTIRGSVALGKHALQQKIRQLKKARTGHIAAATVTSLLAALLAAHGIGRVVENNFMRQTTPAHNARVVTINHTENGDDQLRDPLLPAAVTTEHVEPTVPTESQTNVASQSKTTGGPEVPAASGLDATTVQPVAPSTPLRTPDRRSHSNSTSSNESGSQRSLGRIRLDEYGEFVAPRSSLEAFLKSPESLATLAALALSSDATTPRGDAHNPARQQESPHTVTDL